MQHRLKSCEDGPNPNAAMFAYISEKKSEGQLKQSSSTKSRAVEKTESNFSQRCITTGEEPAVTNCTARNSYV